jgi:hypothetical protein
MLQQIKNPSTTKLPPERECLSKTALNLTIRQSYKEASARTLSMNNKRRHFTTKTPQLDDTQSRSKVLRKKKIT